MQGGGAEGVGGGGGTRIERGVTSNLELINMKLQFIYIIICIS